MRVGGRGEAISKIFYTSLTQNVLFNRGSDLRFFFYSQKLVLYLVLNELSYFFLKLFAVISILKIQ